MAIAFKGKARASYIIVCALQLTLPTIAVVGAPRSIQQVLQYVTFTDDYSRYTNVHENSGLP